LSRFTVSLNSPGLPAWPTCGCNSGLPCTDDALALSMMLNVLITKELLYDDKEFVVAQ